MCINLLQQLQLQWQPLNKWLTLTPRMLSSRYGGLGFQGQYNFQSKSHVVRNICWAILILLIPSLQIADCGLRRTNCFHHAVFYQPTLLISPKLFRKVSNIGQWNVPLMPIFSLDSPYEWWSLTLTLSGWVSQWLSVRETEELSWVSLWLSCTVTESHCDWGA